MRQGSYFSRIKREAERRLRKDILGGAIIKKISLCINIPTAAGRKICWIGIDSTDTARV
jgi:hypothetical protein